MVLETTPFRCLNYDSTPICYFHYYPILEVCILLQKPQAFAIKINPITTNYSSSFEATEWYEDFAEFNN